jgi:hypothetical protein
MIKWFACLLLSLSAIQIHAHEYSNPYNVQVSVISEDRHFRIQASYEVPIDICAAYAFITDYEGAKNIPGILESKVISRVQNKVRVQRSIKEEILFFPIVMNALVEYTEASNRLLTFNQISGDNKFYRGSWRLSEMGDKTLFRYESVFEPDSVVPSWVIQYFMRNSIRGRFEVMAQRAAQTKFAETFSCN